MHSRNNSYIYKYIASRNYKIHIMPLIKQYASLITSYKHLNRRDITMASRLYRLSNVFPYKGRASFGKLPKNRPSTGIVKSSCLSGNGEIHGNARVWVSNATLKRNSARELTSTRGFIEVSGDGHRTTKEIIFVAIISTFFIIFTDFVTSLKSVYCRAKNAEIFGRIIITKVFLWPSPLTLIKPQRRRCYFFPSNGIASVLCCLFIAIHVLIDGRVHVRFFNAALSLIMPNNYKCKVSKAILRFLI